MGGQTVLTGKIARDHRPSEARLGQREMPFYEHYYAGGFSSVRGFKDNTLGARSTPSRGEAVTGNVGTEADPDQKPQPFGGNVLIAGGVEMIFPMPFVKDQRSLRSSLFLDMGNVFDTSCSSSQKARNDDSCGIDITNMAASLGVGVTWVSGFGPLSFSLATPVSTPKDAQTQVFQFSMGQSF